MKVVAADRPPRVPPQMERLFHLRVGAGVVVAQVVPGSAAAKAGLRPGDVIVALGGTKVTTVETFSLRFGAIAEPTACASRSCATARRWSCR